MKVANVVAVLVAASWALDATTSGLETSVRWIYLSACLVLAAVGLLSLLRHGRMQLLGIYALMSGLWMVRGVGSGASMSVALLDLLVVTALVVTAASRDVDRWSSRSPSKGSQIILVIGMAAAVSIGLSSGGSARGELPPTLLVAVAAMLILKGRRISGVICLGGYLALTATSGFRSSVLLVVVALLIVGLQLFSRASVGGKSFLLLVMIPLAFWGASAAQVALQSESAQSLRAVEFATGGGRVLSSDAARIAEIRSVRTVISESSLPELLIGRGHGSSVLGPEFERRTAHNVWVTFAVRYGMVGLVAVITVHVRVLRSLILRRGKVPFGMSDFIAIAGALVLLNGYLRFAVAELSELIVLALAAGVVHERTA